MEGRRNYLEEIIKLEVYRVTENDSMSNLVTSRSFPDRQPQLERRKRKKGTRGHPNSTVFQRSQSLSFKWINYSKELWKSRGKEIQALDDEGTSIVTTEKWR